MNSRNTKRLERLLEYIEEHLDEPMTVESLAANMSLSRWQFQRCFREFTGVSVARYVRRRRLTLATSLLLTTEQRQLEVALACGFESEIGFHRAFSAQYGCTPGQFRRRNSTNL